MASVYVEKYRYKVVLLFLFMHFCVLLYLLGWSLMQEFEPEILKKGLPGFGWQVAHNKCALDTKVCASHFLVSI